MGIWKKEEYQTSSLNEDIETDTLIIGGGLTGLMTSYYLDNRDVCVVDARAFGEGVTKNTTAKITYLQDNIYTKIKNWRGKKKARKYLHSQKETINELVRIIKKENIKCDLKVTPSYIFASTKSEIPKLKKEYEFLKDSYINIKEEPLPMDVKSYLSYKVEDTYTFNPLKFLTGIINILKKRNVKLYENTKIIKIYKDNDKYICCTSKFKIKAKHVVIATNYPHFLFPLLMPLKCYVEKSHIIVSRVEDYKNLSCINVDKTGFSCRFYKDKGANYQISLGASHNIAFKENDKSNFDKVQEFWGLLNQNIKMKYTNTDVITPDYLPFIGKLKENMYISTGYNTWGMTNSVLGSRILSDLINEKNNIYVSLFNPKRITLAHILKLPIYIISNTKSFISSKLFKNKSWYNKETIQIDKNIGTYIDENGLIHKVSLKCPHLGCNLVFNEIEKTWDCPCHSSKFSLDGKCIKGPSNKDIKIN